MKQLIALLAAAGLTLAACNKEEAPKSAPESKPAAEAPAPANDTAPAEAPAHQAAPAPAPAPAGGAQAEARKPSVDVENDPRRATAQGTLEMFVVTMREGDYETALELIDPSSDGYIQIQEAFNAMLSASDKRDGEVNLADLYKALFTQAWKHAELEPVGEQEGHVKYTIKFQKADPVSVDVRNSTGSWLIIAPANIFVMEQVEEAPPPADQAAPPASGGN